MFLNKLLIKDQYWSILEVEFRWLHYALPITEMQHTEAVQKQPKEVFYNKGVLKNFAIFTERRLCHVFSCEIYEIFKNNYFGEHLQGIGCFWQIPPGYICVKKHVFTSIFTRELIIYKNNKKRHKSIEKDFLKEKSNGCLFN